MPIQINLLSENIAAEEEKRNDPVKRATWVGAFCVFLMLLWYSTVLVEGMVVSSNLEEKQGEWAKLKDEDENIRKVSANIRQSRDRIAALDQLAAHRFLWAPVLSALTQTMVPDVQLTSFRVSQTYVVVAPPKEQNEKRKNPLPPTATEKIIVSLDARDYSDQSKQNYKEMTDRISRSPFFSAQLADGGLKLAKLLPPSSDSLDDSGRSFVQFTLECKFPEKVRK